MIEHEKIDILHVLTCVLIHILLWRWCHLTGRVVVLCRCVVAVNFIHNFQDYFTHTSVSLPVKRPWDYATFPIVIIFFRGCVPEMFVTSYSVTFCIYVPGKLGISFHYYCAVYDECKYSDTFWLAVRTRLFVQYTISLSSLCKIIWRHCLNL